MTEQQYPIIYYGKIQAIECDNLRVSLWTPLNQEIVTTMPPAYFPIEPVKIGEVFKYGTSRNIEGSVVRELSKIEMDKLREEIDRELDSIN
jgi:hypothetical protein